MNTFITDNSRLGRQGSNVGSNSKPRVNFRPNSNVRQGTSARLERNTWSGSMSQDRNDREEVWDVWEVSEWNEIITKE